MKKLVCLLSLVSLSTFAASGMDPSLLELKIKSMYVSESGDCSNPIEVFTNTPDVADLSFVDFTSSPTLAQNVALADGTYNCIIIGFSDNIRVTPASSGTYCVADTAFTSDVCQANYGASFADYDGSALGTCTDDEQLVYMFLSTWSSSTGGDQNNNAFQPPQSDGDATRGIKLNGALIKSGSATSKFYVDASGQVEDNNFDNECSMQPPVFGFTPSI